jgi:hypothetical protein
MKVKLSATIEEPLIEFLDSVPGKTRSEKLERILETFRLIEEERRLRQQLGQSEEDKDERAEQEAWERTMGEAMWSE